MLAECLQARVRGRTLVLHLWTAPKIAGTVEDTPLGQLNQIDWLTVPLVKSFTKSGSGRFAA